MSIVSNDTKIQFYNDPLNAMLPPSLMALFPNTGWYLLYLYMCLYLNDSFYILFRSFVPDAGTLYDGHKDEMQRI